MFIDVGAPVVVLALMGGICFGQDFRADKAQLNGPLNCYVCNYFLSGHGMKCDSGQEVWNNCYYCLHTHTVSYLNYHRNQYMTMALDSKVCGKDPHARFANSSRCVFQYSNAGWVRRCFCNSNLCNNPASTVHLSIANSTFILLAYTLLMLAASSWQRLSVVAP